MPRASTAAIRIVFISHSIGGVSRSAGWAVPMNLGTAIIAERKGEETSPSWVYSPVAGILRRSPIGGCAGDRYAGAVRFAGDGALGRPGACLNLNGEIKPGEAGLFLDVLQVLLNRLGADEQSLGDVLVLPAAPDELGDFPFPRAQSAESIALGGRPARRAAVSSIRLKISMGSTNKAAST